ncbi:MAG: tyrosine protein kinase [Tannerellaceae bacterium]|jgi:uncharacterized protein involved in exopolysaccharide biosynthesis|nr:tyrosine protein kinase [Tannerellaceae bacterium]
MDTQDTATLGLKTILVNYLLHWKLFTVAFVLSTILAVLYLMMTPRTYGMKAIVQIQDVTELGSGGSVALGEAAGLMKSFGFGGGSTGSINMDDEIMIFKSNALFCKMALELGLNVNYSRPYSFHLLYHPPLRLTTDQGTSLRLEEAIDFKVAVDDGRIVVKTKSASAGKKDFVFASLPAVISLGEGDFTLDYAPGAERMTSGKLNITYRPVNWVAEELAKNFLIEEVSKSSNMIEFACEDHEKQRGMDKLTTLIAQYNKVSSDYLKKDAGQTVSFLDQRIDSVTYALKTLESQIAQYKNRNHLLTVEHDAGLYLEQMKEFQSRLIELEAQSYIIRMVQDFIADPEHQYSLLPPLFLQEGDKGSPIASYNELLIERSRVIQNSNLSNPMVKNLTAQADKLRESVVLSISNAQKGMESSIKEIKKKEAAVYNKVNNFPAVERDFTELKRQQEIYQAVYLVLIQKREDTSMKAGLNKDKARLIDEAYVEKRPIAPRKLFAAIGILLFTLVVPVSLLLGKSTLKSLFDEYHRVTG